MISQKFFFLNILILALNSKKLFEIAISDKFQLDLRNNDQDIGTLLLTCKLWA